VLRAYRFHPGPLTLLPNYFLSLVAVVTSGCNASPPPGAASPTTSRTLSLHGLVYGGKRPVTVATIQLYAAGTGGAFGAGATALYCRLPTTTTPSASRAITNYLPRQAISISYPPAAPRASAIRQIPIFSYDQSTFNVPTNAPLPCASTRPDKLPPLMHPGRAQMGGQP
jgi:hypothetical protein